jgi:hypothetical protein
MPSRRASKGRDFGSSVQPFGFSLSCSYDCARLGRWDIAGKSRQLIERVM